MDPVLKPVASAEPPKPVSGAGDAKAPPKVSQRLANEIEDDCRLLVGCGVVSLSLFVPCVLEQPLRRHAICASVVSCLL